MGLGEGQAIALVCSACTKRLQQNINVSGDSPC